MVVWWHILLIVVCSYFVGNISFSRIIAHSKKQDITKLGSGNAGSTNVLRNFGLFYGVLNLILDILKGFLPALLAYHLSGHNLIYLYTAGLSVIIGHNYPVIFKFKGGKGIASMLGVFLAADPIATLIVIGCALVVWLIFQYGSVASFICVTILTVIEGIKAQQNIETPARYVICLLLFVIFCLTWWAHRSNIERLLLGKENKVSLIKKTKKKIKADRKQKASASVKKQETTKNDIS